MKKYVYKPSGVVVTAPDDAVMPSDLFGKLDAKPKAKKSKPKSEKAPVAEQEPDSEVEKE